MSKWLGECENCDICDDPIKGDFYDAKTKSGPWGIMCEKCFVEHGIALGLGFGQKYDFSTRKCIDGGINFGPEH